MNCMRDKHSPDCSIAVVRFDFYFDVIRCPSGVEECYLFYTLLMSSPQETELYM